MYDRTVNGTVHQFGNTSALYESDMVMVDHETGSYWMQFSGEALVGTLAGERLTALPSQTTTWELWLKQHPETWLLSRETGFDRNYDYDPFTGLGEQLNETGEFIFPVSEIGQDPRLPPGEVVLGVEIGSQQIAYPITRIGDGVVNDEIEAQQLPIVIFSSSNGPTGTAFERTVDGQVLTFAYEDGDYRDLETSSTWNLAGFAISGAQTGSQLTALPTRSSFWFSLITSFPELKLWTGE